MVWWQVLELAEQPDDAAVPQLLVKSISGSGSYTVHLTDLSNIWSEHLSLDGIVERAALVQSPVEVSQQDTTQLGILLDNVMKSLSKSDDASCRITRNDQGGVTLHTNIGLPEPLDSLTWHFCLEKTTTLALKDELILPLLVSSHIQHERINSLISMITDKDKAITRLVDQYESSNLDLAAAFPIISSLKSGRRAIKREQAAKHVTALQPFHDASWRKETGNLQGSHISTLGLFQEALAQTDSKVPSQLKSGNGSTAWWTTLPERLASARAAPKVKAKKVPEPEPKEKVAESSDDETEDEFETHENFKTRNISKINTKSASPSSLSAPNGADGANDESDGDSEDLDLPPKINAHSQTRKPPKPPKPNSSRSASPDMSANKTPASTVKRKGFQIGGKNKKASPGPTGPLGEDEGVPAQMASPNKPSRPFEEREQDRMSPQKPRRPFKIGGKSKSKEGNNETRFGNPTQQQMDDAEAMQASTADTPASPPSRQLIKQETPAAEEHEETPEEKAERKRAELKRKNDEAAKKQAQQKKKKRF